jgi:Zn-dependent alcohol dehydrogenase
MDCPRRLEPFTHRDVEFDKLITTRCKLERINETYAATHRGDNLRGVIVHDTGSRA